MKPINVLVNRIQPLMRGIQLLVVRLLAALPLAVLLLAAMPAWCDATGTQVSPTVKGLPEQAIPAGFPLPLRTNPVQFQDGFRIDRYDVWQKVWLDPTTGARCGDGSPFYFYVKSRRESENLQINLAGGGACWDYDSCRALHNGSELLKNVVRPSGKKNYGAIVSVLSLSNVPVITRLSIPIQSALNREGSESFHPRSQQWNKIFVPYCTGDVHLGLKTSTYTDPSGKGKPLTVSHVGAANVLAVALWARDHLPQAKEWELSGNSAGGVGATALYPALRSLFPQAKSYLINDGGPIFWAPLNANDPSAGLHRNALQVWGLASPVASADALGTAAAQGSVLDWYATLLPEFDRSNMGSLLRAMALHWPQDRFGWLGMQEDYIFSSISYRRFLAETREPDADKRFANTMTLWQQETSQLAQSLQDLPNVGYYLPWSRHWLAGHTILTKPDHTAAIEDAGLMPQDFIQDVLDGTGPVMKVREHNGQHDAKQWEPMSRLMFLGAPLAGF